MRSNIKSVRQPQIVGKVAIFRLFKSHTAEEPTLPFISRKNFQHKHKSETKRAQYLGYLLASCFRKGKIFAL